MKKHFIIVFLLLVFIPVQLPAAGSAVGANLWYMWVEPDNKEEFMGKNDSTSYNNHFEMTEKAAFVYGLMLTSGITDSISLGGVFSFGTGWKCKADYIYNPGTEVHMFKDYNDIKRFEGDLTLNIRLNEIFKLFLGWKYLGSRGKGEYYYYRTSAPGINYYGRFKRYFDSTGPGIGFTSVINLAGNLYLITTLSGIYEKSTTEVEITGITNSSDDKQTRYSGDCYGGNGIMNLAWIVPDTKVTVSLGGRFQYLKNIENDGSNKYYGALLSAIYSF